MLNHIYICHYSKLTDRKVHMELQLKETGLDKLCEITWLTQFDRETLTKSTILENYRYDNSKMYRICTMSEIALAICHNYAISQIAEKHNYAMIIEDDMVFKENFLENLKYILSFKNDWEILSIGGHYSDKDGDYEDYKNSCKDVTLTNPKVQTTPTGCYILKKTACENIMKQPRFKPFCSPIDETMFYVLNDVKVYWSLPFLCYEGSKGGIFNSSQFEIRGF